MNQKIVIVGGGQAASSCAARLRHNDAECEILLIGNEDFLPYQRPPLSKKYATGDMVRDQLLLRPEDWYGQNRITCHIGVSASRIERQKKQIILADGTAHDYDKLVLATGSRARPLPEEIGGSLDGVYMLRDLADADRVSPELVEGRNVLIVGGGYIGLEAAAVCASKGMKVTLIEAAERILQRVACRETSDWFRELHKAHGVTILEDTGLERLTGEEGRVQEAHLGDGTTLKADFVLVGIGIMPNSELAEEVGLNVDGGISVDAHCRTSDPDIYAAGDCAFFPYRDAGTRLESVQNAIDQAECAADNINGEERIYLPFPWFWSDQYDVKLQIAGLNRGYDKIVVRLGEREGSVSHFYFDGDTFLAVDAMNDPRTYMVGKKMLEAGKNISPAQAADRSLQLKELLQAPA